MLRTPGMTKKLGFLGVGPDEAESLCLGGKWRVTSSPWWLGECCFRGIFFYYPCYYRNVTVNKGFLKVAQLMFSNCYRFVDSFEEHLAFDII